jgi:hypothetical protein
MMAFYESENVEILLKDFSMDATLPEHRRAVHQPQPAAWKAGAQNSGPRCFLQHGRSAEPLLDRNHAGPQHLGGAQAQSWTGRSRTALASRTSTCCSSAAFLRKIFPFWKMATPSLTGIASVKSILSELEAIKKICACA